MEITEQQKEFMRKAIEMADNGMNSGTGGPFGAVIVKNGKIVATGCNQVTSTNDPTAHAEVVAIRNACVELNSFQLDDCDIYTSCEPCPMCLGAIYWARPNRVFYANTKVDAAEIDFDDQFVYDEIDLPLGDRSIPFIQILRNEALSTFQNWAAKNDKIEY